MENKRTQVIAITNQLNIVLEAHRKQSRVRETNTG